MPGQPEVSSRDEYEAWLMGRIRGLLRRSREFAVTDQFRPAAELDVKRRVLIEALDEYQKLKGKEGGKA